MGETVMQSSVVRELTCCQRWIQFADRVICKQPVRSSPANEKSAAPLSLRGCNWEMSQQLGALQNAVLEMNPCGHFVADQRQNPCQNAPSRWKTRVKYQKTLQVADFESRPDGFCKIPLPAPISAPSQSVGPLFGLR